MADGKTYYYLVDNKGVLHVCSGNSSLCGIHVDGLKFISDEALASHKLCKNCDTITLKKTKHAKFETKAELIDEPAKGEQDEH